MTHSYLRRFMQSHQISADIFQRETALWADWHSHPQSRGVDVAKMWFDGSEPYFNDILSHTKTMSSFTRHSLKLAFLSLPSTTATIQLPLETWNKHEEKSQQAKTLTTKIEHHFYRPINNRQFKGPFFVYTNWTHPDSCKGQAKRFLFLQMPLIWSHLLFLIG